MADKCGAKTRAGGRCRKPKMPNGRCRFHGGMSTGPKVPNTQRNAFKHGMRVTFLTPDERASVVSSYSLDNVDEEIHLNRFLLVKTVEAKAKANGRLEVDEIIKRDLIGVEGSKKDTHSKVRDYDAKIDKITARIESLMKTRFILRANGDIDPADMDAAKLTPGTPDEPAPANPIR